MPHPTHPTQNDTVASCRLPQSPIKAAAKKACAAKPAAKTAKPSKQSRKSSPPKSPTRARSSPLPPTRSPNPAASPASATPSATTAPSSILAVDTTQNPADPTILIERQYRHSAGQFLLELPAGRIEPGEAPLAAAKRELIEETGYRARKWSKLTRYYASPGFLAETMQIFLAEDIRPGIAEPEEDEKIELLHLPLSELLNLIHAGKVLDGKTIIGTLFFARWYFDRAI